MEKILNDLIVQVESLKRQHNALVKAVLNIKGFYIETEDGSEQGLIKYGVQPAQVEPIPADGGVA